MRVASTSAMSTRASAAGGRPAIRAGFRAAPVVASLLALSLVGCGGRLPAPVDSRVDEAVTRQAVTESEAPTSGATATSSDLRASSSDAAAPSPGVDAVPSDAPQPLSPLPAAALVATEADIAVSGSSGSVKVMAEPVEAPAKRLAALSPAIRELLNVANRHSTEGRHDGAAAALERALQIEPKDAALWHRLARTRLDQGRADLAEALAAKSTSLATGDPNLQAQNWRLIAKARQKQGDTSGAEDALERAARLAQ